MNSLRRRVLLALTALGAGLTTHGRAQSDRVVVEGGVPQRLTLSAVEELGIEVPDTIEGDPIALAVLTLGSLDVASGRLVAADGMLLEAEPFASKIAAGRYPLQLVVAQIGDEEEERIAFVQLKLAPARAVSWANALPEGEEAGDSEMIGYDVESGIGCLFDASALATYRRELARGDRIYRNLEQVLRANRRSAWTWARIGTEHGSGYIFTSGYGDGYYGSYWGKDAAGRLVSLVTDFELLDWAGLPAEPSATT